MLQPMGNTDVDKEGMGTNGSIPEQISYNFSDGATEQAIITKSSGGGANKIEDAQLTEFQVRDR